MIYFKELGNYGRLGNQLFQIFTTMSLAFENDDIAVFPFWKYNKYFKKEINTVENIEDYKIKYEYKEPSFSYSKIPYFKDMNLNGYFQSEKYFLKNKIMIIDNLTLKDEYNNLIKRKWEHLLKTSTVSIHVRRGDYLEKKDFHNCLDINYFYNSLSYIKNIFNIENVLIFSDDIQWCKDNFIDNNYKYNFIEGQEDIEDMFLMSYCNHNIISNSSFSWWGSWLNKNENKIICAPHQWFGINGYNNWLDIYCDNMTIIK